MSRLGLRQGVVQSSNLGSLKTTKMNCYFQNDVLSERDPGPSRFVLLVPNTSPLFCLEFVGIASIILTMGDMNEPERKGSEAGEVCGQTTRNTRPSPNRFF